MRYRRLDLNLLVALDALLSEKSVTRAAARLNISQPAMSGVLARLRDFFADQLVVQVGRQMELTPLAQTVAAPVQDIIMRIDSVIASEPAFEPRASKRHFSITVSDYVLRVFLLDVLKRIYREAPGVTFEFRQSSGRARDALESGEVDFVIAPEIDVLPEHPHTTLFEDTYTIIAWAGSSVVGDTLSFDQYMGLGHVVFRSEEQGNPWLERWFLRQYGDARRIEVAAASFSLLPHVLVGTDRIATIQRRLARQYVQTLPLKLIDAPVELPKLVETLQWNVHRDPDPAGRWLRAKLNEVPLGAID
jgi:LysR family transcriptional regulator, nod-box dependent transcriptional activator